MILMNTISEPGMSIEEQLSIVRLEQAELEQRVAAIEAMLASLREDDDAHGGRS